MGRRRTRRSGGARLDDRLVGSGQRGRSAVSVGRRARSPSASSAVRDEAKISSACADISGDSLRRWRFGGRTVASSRRRTGVGEGALASLPQRASKEGQARGRPSSVHLAPPLTRLPGHRPLVCKLLAFKPPVGDGASCSDAQGGRAKASDDCPGERAASSDGGRASWRRAPLRVWHSGTMD